MAFTVKNKNVIVTGGGKGIGYGITEVFLKEGANVVFSGRNVEQGERTVKELSKYSGKIKFIRADVTNLEETKNLFEMANKFLGSVDIVILNAGYFPQNRIKDMSLEDWDTVVDINLKGVFINTKIALDYLKEGGRIVVTSSITGNRVGNPGLAHYSASKGGVNGFIKTAALELSTLGITINAVEPGNIMTPGMEDVLGEKYIKDQESVIPLGKLGTPEDIAYAILFLASDEARYITGQSIIVDGGQTLPESAFDIH
ncbi:3-oxoacyl-[acyl-carrier-protein] reductase [Peptoniphilus sp. ING2-D1G]|nr:3-oxoacyl-[acyl-carrier-protein] reductase [Peptoniphilus sp. ING2-D1G]